MPVLRIRIRRIRMFLGLLGPDPFVKCMDPDPTIKQTFRKTVIPTVL
jgi:hypothetical protein